MALTILPNLHHVLRIYQIVMNYREPAVVTQAGSRHLRPLQVAAKILHALPGSPGLLREVYLPVPAVLRLQITLPLALVTDVAQIRQHAG